MVNRIIKATTFFIYCGLLLLFLSSCSPERSPETKTSVFKGENTLTSEDSVDFKLSFQKALKSNVSESENYAMIDSFFHQSKSPISDYCYYFRYLLLAKDESLNESFGYDEYNMLLKFPAKGKKIDELINLLPKETQRSLYNRIMWSMCLELQANEYDLNSVKSEFQFLLNEITIQAAKECISNRVK